jgi:hypothetical protein
MAARRRFQGFGYDADESPLHFAVVRGAKQVRIEERHGVTPDDGADRDVRKPVLSAVLDAYRWSRVSEAAREDFNRRLRATGSPPGVWRERETLLAPHLGKELVLLAWVVEEADPTLIPNMVANWAGLAPEERWWFYTTINATSGHPEHGRHRGWRKAIKIALAENPSAGSLVPISVHTRDSGELRPAKSGGNRNTADGQLQLLPEDRPA